MRKTTNSKFLTRLLTIKFAQSSNCLFLSKTSELILELDSKMQKKFQIFSK